MKRSKECQKVFSKLNFFLEKELNETDRASVLQHLEKCSNCQAEYRKLLEETKLFSSLTAPQISSLLTEKILRIPRQSKPHLTLFKLKRRFAPIPAAAIILVSFFSAMVVGNSLYKLNQEGRATDFTEYTGYLTAEESLYTIWEGISNEY